MKRLDRFRVDVQEAANRDARMRARRRVYGALLGRHTAVSVLKHAHQVEAVLTRAERAAETPLFECSARNGGSR